MVKNTTFQDKFKQKFYASVARHASTTLILPAHDCINWYELLPINDRDFQALAEELHEYLKESKPAIFKDPTIDQKRQHSIHNNHARMPTNHYI